MNSPHTSLTDVPIARFHRGGVFFIGPQRIARCEEMARIEADAESFLFLHTLQDRFEMLEPAAERTPLTGSHFQPEFGLHPLRAGVRFI